MPTLLTEAPPPLLLQDVPRKRWTRADCKAIEATGLLDQQSLELVEGELISKKGKNRPHVQAFTVLLAWLYQNFAARLINVEAPIDVAPEDNPTSEPEPDVIVLRREYELSNSSAPQPENLARVVEVADTSLAFDLTVKAGLYARAAIVEYWVIDTNGRRLIVHREPKNGTYASVVAYDESESVAPLAAPEAQFAVATVFPG